MAVSDRPFGKNGRAFNGRLRPEGAIQNNSTNFSLLFTNVGMLKN